MIKVLCWSDRNEDGYYLIINFEINGKEFQRFSEGYRLIWWRSINRFMPLTNKYLSEEQCKELESMIKAYFDSDGKFKEQLQLENN